MSRNHAVEAAKQFVCNTISAVHASAVVALALSALPAVTVVRKGAGPPALSEGSIHSTSRRHLPLLRQILHSSS